MNQIRKATLADLDALNLLINSNASLNLLLPLAPEKIGELIRDFFVAESPNGECIGCVALHIYSPSLAEIRSLAVKENFRNQGAGSLLVRKCLEESRQIGILKVFALTRAVSFFKKLGFETGKKENLPEKVFKDCLLCPLFHHCDETAVIFKRH